MNVREKVVFAASEVFAIPVAAIGEDASAHNIEAWDSLKHVSLIVALEQEFGVRFTAEQIVDMLSIAQIVDTVTTLVSKSGYAPRR